MPMLAVYAEISGGAQSELHAKDRELVIAAFVPDLEEAVLCPAIDRRYCSHAVTQHAANCN